jgi:hypothetical protein
MRLPVLSVLGLVIALAAGGSTPFEPFMEQAEKVREGSLCPESCPPNDWICPTTCGCGGGRAS